jgi:transketolase
MFHDYMRPSVRLSALMGQQVVYIYTHDSIFLGEDGPTHQPVETLVALRTIPNVAVLRPADAHETVEAWKAALLRKDGPTALILTRQNLPVQDQARAPATGLHRGAYVLSDAPGEATKPEIILLATGSEVALAQSAQSALAQDGVRARVVSAPWFERFEQEDPEYQASVLPAGVPIVAIEAGLSYGWRHVVGATGAVIGIDRFGASAPDKVLAEKFGFTTSHVVATAKRVLGR